MIYYTKKQTLKEEQVTWDDLLSGKIDPYSSYLVTQFLKEPTGTITRVYMDECPPTSEEDKRDWVDAAVRDWVDAAVEMKYISRMQGITKRFLDKYKDLYSVDRQELYHKFFIPKQHGGKREINEPNPVLMQALNEIRYCLETSFGGLYHTAAFAYVKGRSTKDMDMKHVLNESNWFLKTDFSGFFPSTTLEFVMHMFSLLYPFNYVYKDAKVWADFTKMMSLAFLDGGLPQGSPVSPTITNMMMIPIDHILFNTLAKRRMVYTRYADDITISCVQSFPYKEIINLIRDTLKKFNAPFELKDEKTKYVNNKGSNWILGLMVNKDHKVTIGHDKEKYFKAQLCNFIMDTKNRKRWDPDDVVEMNGLLAYYSMVEKDYFKYLIDHMNKKFNVDTIAMIKQAMKRW